MWKNAFTLAEIAVLVVGIAMSVPIESATAAAAIPTLAPVPRRVVLAGFLVSSEAISFSNIFLISIFLSLFISIFSIALMYSSCITATSHESFS